MAVYTKGFSRSGLEFLTWMQVFPGESVRILLATFRVRLHVVRSRRITCKCYEIGATLVEHHEASADAFEIAMRSDVTSESVA